MKNRFGIASWLALSLTLAGAAPAHANFDIPFQCMAGERTLEEVMKEMGAVSKALATSLADPSRNPESAEGARRLDALATESLPLCVPKLEAMTDAEAKAAEYAEYGRMMTELGELSRGLGVSLDANDNDAASATFGKIRALQRAAHSRFRG